MIDKLFTEHPYIATWLVLELIFAISLFGWALASSETIADLMVPNFVYRTSWFRVLFVRPLVCWPGKPSIEVYDFK